MYMYYKSILALVPLSDSLPVTSMRRQSCYSKIPENRQRQNTVTVKKNKLANRDQSELANI